MVADIYTPLEDERAMRRCGRMEWCAQMLMMHAETLDAATQDGERSW